MRVYREITPITHSDVFVVLDSVNKGFDYPIHNHPEFELTLILNSAGTRIVGDSTESYHDGDLVLLGQYLYHKWDDRDRAPDDPRACRVITIQFDMHLFDKQFFSRKPFYQVKSLLENAGRGIEFKGNTFLKIREIMCGLSSLKGLDGVLSFIRILDILSQSTEYRYLTSEGFDWKTVKSQSRRLQAAYQYIIQHFRDGEIKMSNVAHAVNLSDSAFSHFFKKSTNKSFTHFLNNMRLGHAARLLLETDDLVRDVCAASGFNNIANFNRSFKKMYACTPHDYRKSHLEKTSFDWTEQRTPGQFLPADQEVRADYKPTEYDTNLVHA